MKAVLADTGPLYAAEDSDDERHGRSQEDLERLEREGFENFMQHAEALNRVEEEYEMRVEEFKGAMGCRLGETEVSVVRFLPGDTRIYQKVSFIGTVLEDAGLPVLRLKRSRTSRSGTPARSSSPRWAALREITSDPL